MINSDTNAIPPQKSNRFLPLFDTMVLAVGMLVVAKLSKSTALIFPEGGAIALGCWVNQDKRWLEKPWQIVVLPTLAAALGVGLNLMKTSFPIREWLALSVVTALLFIAKSSIGPTISAAILPIVLNIHEWIFVLSVLLLTLVVMISVLHRGKPPTDESASQKERLLRDVIFLLSGTLWIGVSAFLHLHFAVIPPLMVFLFDSLSKRTVSISLAIRQIVVLFTAALTGVFTIVIWPHDIVISGSAALIGAILLMRLFNALLPPAMAITLLPLLFHPLPLLQYPMCVFLISVTVFTISRLWNARYDQAHITDQ